MTDVTTPSALAGRIDELQIRVDQLEVLALVLERQAHLNCRGWVPGCPGPLCTERRERRLRLRVVAPLWEQR